VTQRSRTAILRSTVFLGHDTGDHPERASRIIVIDCELERRKLIRPPRPTIACTPADDEAILRVHAPELLQRLERVTAAGGGWIDPDTVARVDSLDVARVAVGGAINAIEAIVAGRIDRAFLIARPPGHHATRDRAMGFCLLNTVAIAAAHARSRGFERIAILDFDVHHGNGTQDIFYGRSDVLYCSLHQALRPDGSLLFPGTGDARENGTGAGTGYTLNVPLPPGTGDAGFLDALRSQVIPAIDRYAPDLLLLSAGFDAHHDDPLANLEVSDAGFRSVMDEAVATANRHCGGRLLAVLEGGYDAPALAGCVADAISVLDDTPGPAAPAS